jgi:hypothetical protein
MSIQIHDGNQFQNTSFLFAHTGTQFEQVNQLWVHDGTAFTLIYGGVVLSASISLSQTGTESEGACVDPYKFAISWKLDSHPTDHTISVGIGMDTPNPPSITEYATALPITTTSYEHTVTGLATGLTTYYYRAQVRVIRNSDSAIVSQRYTSVGSELADTCIT